MYLKINTTKNRQMATKYFKSKHILSIITAYRKRMSAILNLQSNTSVVDSKSH